MKNNFFAYILRMLAFYALIALLPIEFTMIIGASLFAVAALASSVTSLLVMTVIGVIIFSMFSTDFISGLLTVLAFVIPGCLQGIMIRGRKSLSGILAVTTIARGGLLLLAYDRMADMENQTIKDMILGETPEYLLEKLSKEGYGEEVIEMFSSGLEVVGNMIPSAIVISALSFAFLSLAFTKLYTRRTPLLFAGMRKFSDIKADVSLTLASMLIIAALFFVDAEFKIVLVNCLYVLYCIFTVTGFAFAYRVLKKALKSRGAAFAISCVIGIFSFGLLMPVMGIVGSFVKTDFDKIEIDNDSENENRKDD